MTKSPCLRQFSRIQKPAGNRPGVAGCSAGVLLILRTISGNSRQFNYRDESAGLCVSAQKNITTKIDFLYLLILVFVFRRKQVRSALKNKSILCYNIDIVETIDQKENRDAAVT